MLELPGCRVDLRTRLVETATGARVRLTSGEATLLAFLSERPDTDVDRETLMQEVFGYAPGARSRAVDATVKRLRKKLGDVEGFGIQTVHGVGYRYAPWTAARTEEVSNVRAPEGLVGRADILVELGEALVPGAIVTLTGPGGVGKTRLASEIAAARRAAGERAWFVDLASVESEDALLSEIARVLALPTDADPAPRLRAALTARQGLLVLDNLEQVVDAAAAWLRRVGAFTGLALLCTSREPLGLRAETVVRLRPLEPDAGVRLFRALSGSTAPDGHLQRVVDKLDGLPLAIELAAARLETASLEQLESRLDRPFQVLREASRDRTPRHAALWATIEWSWALLDDAARLALRQLAVFQGRFTLEAAEAVLDLPASAPWALDVLAELERRSLLHADVPEFWMLHGVRAFGAAQGIDDATRARHAAAVLALGSAAMDRLEGLDVADASAALTRLGPDLRAAFAFARAAHDSRTLVGLARILDRVLFLHGPWTLREQVLDVALDHAVPVERGPLLRARADAHRVRGRLEAAEEVLGRALAGAVDDTDRAYSLTARSKLRRDAGRMDAAFADADAAVACGGSDDGALAAAQVQRAASALGHFAGDAALPPIREALAACRALGRKRGEGLCLAYLGIALSGSGRDAEAAECLVQALDVFRIIAAGPARTQILAELARMRLEQGRLDGAEMLLQFAQTWFRDAGDDGLVGQCALHLGLVAHANGNTDDAIEHHSEAVSCFERAADPVLADVARSQLAAALAGSSVERAAALLVQVDRGSRVPLVRAMAALARGELDLVRLAPEAATEAVAAHLAEAEAIAGPMDRRTPAYTLTRRRVSARLADLTEAS